MSNCKRGHIDPPRRKNGACVLCQQEYGRAYRAKFSPAQGLEEVWKVQNMINLIREVLFGYGPLYEAKDRDSEKKDFFE